jgi:hypothetical protein
LNDLGCLIILHFFKSRGTSAIADKKKTHAFMGLFVISELVRVTVALFLGFEKDSNWAVLCLGS